MLESKMDKVHDGLVGTITEPGLRQIVQQMNDTVIDMKDQVCDMKSEQRTLLDDRLKIKGAILVAGLVCGFLGWVSNKLF